MAEKQDIFGRLVDLGQPFAADAARLLIPSIGNEDQLVQQFTAQYQQNINRLWEVGSPKTYFVAGRTQGQMTIKRVVGAKGIANEFISKFGNVCNIAGNHMTLALVTGCNNSGGQGSITAAGCVITSVAYAVAAVDMIINEDLSLLFARMEKAA